MSKWTFRLIGLVVVVVISSILFRSWFFPKTIPPALKQEISLHVDGQEQPITAPAHTASNPPAPTNKHDNTGDNPPAPPLTLLSYDEIKKAAPPEDSPPAENPNRPAPVTPTPTVVTPVVPAAPVAPVTNAPPPPPPAPEAPPAEPDNKTVITVDKNAPTPRGGNWIQAGAFSSQENTRNFVARLKRKSWPVVTEDAVVNGKLVHRVLIGPLSPADVETYINILGKMGFNARQISR